MHMLHWGLRLIVLVVFPASMGLIVLAGPLVVTLYQYGQFSLRDAWMCQQALMAYSSGLLFFITARVLTTVCYSQQDMKMPVKIAMMALGCNVIFNIVLTQLFAHTGLAMATTLASLVNVLGLLIVIRRRKLLAWHQVGIAQSIKMIAAALLMGMVLFYLQGDIKMWAEAHALARAGRLLGLVASGMVIYLLTIFLLGLRPRHFFLRK
jgi:putative peptidoglycan lipid II flippase